MARVVLVRMPGILGAGGAGPAARWETGIAKGIAALWGGNPEKLLAARFPRGVRVGVKVNCIGGPALSTHPAIVAALAANFVRSGRSPEDLIVWDRSEGEVRKAGFSRSSAGAPVAGTDSSGYGYRDELTVSGEVGSRLSRIAADVCGLLVSCPILKDHNLAGVTGAMKNYFGALNNPNKYHDDNCLPFIPDCYRMPELGGKTRLVCMDVTRVQFHKGPSYHADWNERLETVLLADDPVAADAVGWRIVEKLRADRGLSPLASEKREPAYIQEAAGASYRLGVADAAKIERLEVTA